MPEAPFQVLPYFDGRPTEETLEEIRAKEKLRLQPALVRRLADFGILEVIEETIKTIKHSSERGLT